MDSGRYDGWGSGNLYMRMTDQFPRLRSGQVAEVIQLYIEHGDMTCDRVQALMRNDASTPSARVSDLERLDGLLIPTGKRAKTAHGGMARIMRLADPEEIAEYLATCPEKGERKRIEGAIKDKADQGALAAWLTHIGGELDDVREEPDQAMAWLESQFRWLPKFQRAAIRRAIATYKPKKPRAPRRRKGETLQC